MEGGTQVFFVVIDARPTTLIYHLWNSKDNKNKELTTKLLTKKWSFSSNIKRKRKKKHRNPVVEIQNDKSNKPQ